MEIFTTRFVIENQPYYFRWEWGTDHFSCQVTNGKYAWDGKADQKYIQSKLLPEGMEFFEMMCLLKQGLREQDVQQKRFSYQMYSGQVQGDITFGWKIKIDENVEESETQSDGEIFIKGYLLLKRQNPHLIIQNILENFYSKVSLIEKQNETFIQSNKTLQEQNTGALKQMKQMASDKITMEHELMQKFVLVLNEKKKKIRELTDKIKELEKNKIREATTRETAMETERVTSKVSIPESIPELKFEEIKMRVIEPKNNKTNRSQPTFAMTDSMSCSQLMDESDPVKPMVRKRHKPVKQYEFDDPTTQPFSLSQSETVGPVDTKPADTTKLNFDFPVIFPAMTSPPRPVTLSLALSTKLLKKKELDADDLLEFVLHHQ